MCLLRYSIIFTSLTIYFEHISIALNNNHINGAYKPVVATPIEL